jgi:hypothetical protein
MPGAVESGFDRKSMTQDLSDYITFTQVADTPEFSVIPKGSINQTLHQTQIDDYGNTDNITGVLSNADVTSFEDELPDLGYTQNYAMKMRETPTIDDMLQNVDENPALKQGFYAEAVRKAVVRLKHRMIKQFLSGAVGVAQSGSTPYQSCGIGGFMQTTAGTLIGAQTVPVGFRPDATQVQNVSLANLASGASATLNSEDLLLTILQELFEVTYGLGQFTAFAGSSIKKTISLASIYDFSVTGATAVRRINSDNDAVLKTTVDQIHGDFGTIDIIPTPRIMRFDNNGVNTSIGGSTSVSINGSTGLTATVNIPRGSMFILDLSKWALAFKRAPGHRSLEDRGGGPRGIVDAIFSIRAKAPNANGAIFCTS